MYMNLNNETRAFPSSDDLPSIYIRTYLCFVTYFIQLTINSRSGHRMRMRFVIHNI